MQHKVLHLLSGSTSGAVIYTNGSSSPSGSSHQPRSADIRAAAVHGAHHATNNEELSMRKPTKLEALRMPTPKKGKKKSRQQTWDNIDEY